MSVANPKIFSLHQARYIAYDIGRKLSDHCETDRIHIAGSLRREVPVINDIEMVVIPKKRIVPGKNLFGEDTSKVLIGNNFIDTVLQLGKVLKGKADGRFMQIELPEKIILDLFMPQPHDFFRILAIRTGSVEYSKRIIANGWLKIGWCGTYDGLRLQKDCEEVPYTEGNYVKRKWVCKIPNPALPPAWTSEEHFFKWLGIQWLHPKMRNL